MMIAARELKSGMSIKIDGRAATVDRLNYCDGIIEPLHLCGGAGLNTAAALRIHLADGDSVLTHPSIRFAVAG
jgi:hypothetical protein